MSATTGAKGSSYLPTQSRGRDDSKMDEFRAAVNAAALEGSISLSQLLHNALDARTASADRTIVSQVFCDGMIGIKQVRQKFTANDLADVFADADEGEKQRLTVEELVDVFQRTISKARALSLKLRAAIIKDYKTEAEQRKVFATISTTGGFSEKEKFTQFAEDVLKVHINDNDALGLYSLYDMDGNGKVSADDFIGFLLGITKDAHRALSAGSGEVIVDIKISGSSKEESELLRNGYVQVVPDAASLQAQGTTLASHGSFGKGQSMWIWRRKQGTCSGRLRPVLDVQVNSKATSSALVLAGYSCLPNRISGQYVWIKRSAGKDEDLDGLQGLCVTLGKRSSRTAERALVSPGTGWMRVDGNFAKSMLSSSEASLWMLPLRARSLDNQLSGSMQSGIAMSEEKRLAELLGICRRAIRHFVPLSEMKRLATLQLEDGMSNSMGVGARADRMFDFSVVYHSYDPSGRGKMSQSKFSVLLRDAGAHIDSTDIPHVFRYFDFNLGGTIGRDEYAQVLSLTKTELADVTDMIRASLLDSDDGSKSSSSQSAVNASSIAGQGSTDSAIATTKASVRTNRVLGEVFRLVNANGSGIISLDEVIDMASKLEIFLTEAEAQSIFKEMDTNDDGRVEESDFLTFIKRKSEVASKTAYQVAAAANEIRGWLRQGLASNVSGATVSTAKPWAELKTRHEKSTGKTFPNFVGPDDLAILVASLGKRMHLSPSGARALALLVAPDKFGRIQQADLQSFISRPVRSFGELLALLERDVMKPVLDSYKAYLATVGADGVGNQALLDVYGKLVEEVVREVHGTTAVQSLGGGGGAQDVVAIPQLKAGVEAAMSRLRQFEGTVPNIEEWASLGCLVGAVVTGDEAYGVHPREFVKGICEQCIGEATAPSQVVPLDIICKELQRLIRDEAWSAGKGSRFDYQASFKLFDTDDSGSITLEEFRLMLVRLQLIDLVPDNQLPALLAKFDSKKKGCITYEDFLSFIDKHKHLASENGTIDVELEDSLDLKTAVKPPIAITRNADCDLLAWTLWKNCCQAEPADPESVVIELESACTESDMTLRAGTVSAKELWNLLFELKIQGTMSKATFEKGVRFLVTEDKGRGESDQTQVDYATLCRYIVRMGRAHKAKVDERAATDQKKYKSLCASLKRELVTTMHEDSSLDDGATPGSGSKGGVGSSGGRSRFDKVFRRLDTDGDGKITPQEFKTGLKRLGIKDEKEWNLRIIALLFKELDEDNSGYLHLSELSRLGSEEDLYRGGKLKEMRTNDKGRDRDFSGKDVSNRDFAARDVDDDEIFGEQRLVNDALLFANVHEVLRERVPMTTAFASHTEAIKDAIHRFFSRYDPDAKGLVSEERFRAFLRRSGLQDRMAASELRRIIESLRQKSKAQASGSSSITIDYELLCQKITTAALDGPGSRAEIILRKMQDAASASAASGRPFMNLCALVDTRFRGFITREELLLTSKMMNCPLSMQELEMLRELLPANAYTADGMVDYREINTLLTHATPRNSILFDIGPRGFAMPHTAYSNTGIFTPRVQAERFSQTAATQLRSSDAGRMSASYGRGLGGGGGVVELLSRIARVLGSSAPLRRILEAYAAEGLIPYSMSAGMVPGATLVSALEDCGVPVSAVESMAIQQTYGRMDDDAVDADAFCGAIDGPQSSWHGHATGAQINSIYTGPRVAARLRELQAEGRNPRDIFEAYDLDRTGTVDKWRFQEVLQRLQLLQSKMQVDSATNDFAHLSNQQLVCYEDFCHVVEASTRGAGNGGGARGVRDSYADNEALSQSNIDRWYTREASPKQRREFGNLYDSLKAFKAANADPRSSREYGSRDFGSSSAREFPITLDDGSFYDGPGLFPPKVSDSLSFRNSMPRPPSSSRYGSRERDSWDLRDGSRSPTREREVHHSGRSSPLPPRTSPSKVGTRMWGNSTSLEEKGRPLKVEDGLWCCAVCLYTENLASAAKCAICDSVNHRKSKDYQVRNQCRNCAFENGQFSSECEMCGNRL